ncbi:hypothetical protein ACU686_33635 [Yinghuangia aomiensis]
MAMFRRNRPPAAGQPAQYGPPTGQPVAVGGGPGSGPGVPPGAVGGAAGPGGRRAGPAATCGRCSRARPWIASAWTCGWS